MLALGWGAGHVNALIEGLVIGVLPLGSAFSVAGAMLGFIAVHFALAMLLSDKWRDNHRTAVTPEVTILRLAGVCLAYETLYFAAGVAQPIRDVPANT